MSFLIDMEVNSHGGVRQGLFALYIQNRIEEFKRCFENKKPIYKQPSTRQPKIYETFRTTEKWLRNFRQIFTGFNVKLYRNNVNMTLL